MIFKMATEEERKQAKRALREERIKKHHERMAYLRETRDQRITLVDVIFLPIYAVFLGGGTGLLVGGIPAIVVGVTKAGPEGLSTAIVFGSVLAGSLVWLGYVIGRYVRARDDYL